MTPPAPAPPLGPDVWIFHAGALGDHVLIWPLLRALVRQETSVTLVAAGSHARLAQRVLGDQTGTPGLITPLDAEQRRFTRLWTGEAANESIDPAASTVVSFVADDATPAGRQWLGAARHAFPHAALLVAGPPASHARGALWQQARVPEFGRVAPLDNPRGAILLFTGAGGTHKAWPMASWVALASALGEHAHKDVHLLAGPVELERISAADRSLFMDAQGRTLQDLPELAAILSRARLFIGADTGPTHLAAQLGVPTLALFGPTDPAIWAPVGPQIHVLAPHDPRPMSWLTPETVRADVARFLR